MTKEIWVVILSSSVLAGVIGGLISGFYSLRTKKAEFINAYHDAIIKRRLTAYEALEHLAAELRFCLMDSDNHPYQLLLSTEEQRNRAFALVTDVLSHSIWLSKEAFKGLSDLNIVMSFVKQPKSFVEYAKTNYEVITSIRQTLDGIIAHDLLNLYQVNQFLTSKNVRVEYELGKDWAMKQVGQ
jgi:hypothetical protein